MGITKQLALDELEKSKELLERIKREQENYLINKKIRKRKYNKKHIW